MNPITIDIASTVIQIEPIYHRTARQCEPYRSQGQPVISVSVSREDIDAEYERSLRLPDSYEPTNREAESMFLLRKISDALIDRNTVLIHGAAVAVDNAAYLFIAPSGTGKTTHVRQWLKNRPDAYIVNGDKPFIRVEKTPMVCGSPWNGKENYGVNTIVPLRGIIFMERAEDNRIARCSTAQAFPLLFTQSYRPEDPGKLSKSLQLLKTLISTIPFYRFQFNNFKEDAFRVAYEGVTGRKAENE